MIKSSSRNLLSALIFLICLSGTIFSQGVYEPLHNDVYDYLERLSQKGIIEFNSNILPLSKKYILEKLNETGNKIEKLTSLEKEELDFFKMDYNLESKLNSENRSSLILFKNDNLGRFRLFSYADDLFKINVSPILGYKMGSGDNEKITHLWNGLYFYGYLSENIGFSFDFRDNRETGANIDRYKLFTTETGVTLSVNDENSIEYSEIRTHISYDWDWGIITAGKEFLEWGYGESGKLVLSRKAPSFPYFRLDLNPTEWLSFNYVHAWLTSDVIDSNEVYSSSRRGESRELFREKYFASHSLMIKPLTGLQISLGESIVYSDRLEISYLFPLMFFRLADHYLSKNNNNAGDNSQFFFGISSKNQLPNTHLYGTLFIDEIKIGGLFDPVEQRNQFGFTMGGSITDLPIENLTLTTEYTRIYPFVYRHYIQTQTYENRSYPMGHWMGHNSDLIYGSLNYRFLRGLQAKLWAQYIRKGEDGIVDQQYEQPQPPFLFGNRTNYTYFGVDLRYEFLHELTARAQYQFTKISQEQDSGEFANNNFSEFSLAIYYGL